MSQLLKKYALLAACAVLALFFAMRPAHAQMVDAGGTGEHLIFSYWTTANYTNTLLAIHSPLGVRASAEAKNVVHVRVRSDSADNKTNTVVSFNICLTPGDSWTAVLSMDGLMVGDSGECDEDVYQAASTRAGGGAAIATPMSGEMVTLEDADVGFIEAWLNPSDMLNDDIGSALQQGDTDLAPQDATPRKISGIAMLVSPMAGFSSSYNATALDNCRVILEETGEVRTGDPLPADDDLANATPGGGDDDGNGCWVVSEDGTIDATEKNGGPIMMALAARKHLLTGRWTAIDDENIMSNTKVVLTFPVNHLNYKGKQGPIAGDASAAERAAIGDAEGTDPVSLYVFDEAGMLALNNHELMLDQAVNMCQFMQPSMMGDDMMGDDMMGDDMMAATSSMLYCNGMEVDMVDAVSGEFRIFNNVRHNVGVTADPTVAAPVYALRDSTGRFSDGTELEGIGLNDAMGNLADSDPDTAAPAAELPQMPAQTLGAIGLVFSYFEGTNGIEYDQVTPIQSIMIDTARDGTSGLPDDEDEAGENL